MAGITGITDITSLRASTSEENPANYLGNYIVGVDLGQAHDYTCIGVLEHIWGRLVFEHPGDEGQVLYLPPDDMQYNLVHLERLPLQTSYPAVAEHVKQRLEAIMPLAHCTETLLVDATGVG